MGKAFESEVAGVGIMRPLNDWQLVRLRRMPKGPNKAIAPMAFGLGMTVMQFKQLTPEQKRAAWDAHNRLMEPAGGGMAQPAGQQHPRIPRAYERLSKARAIELGNELLAIKAGLPHGHFRLWVEEKSGITSHQARRFMRAAKAAHGSVSGRVSAAQ